MLKYLFSLIIFTLVFNSAYSQAKGDTLMYFAKDDGTTVLHKEDADYILFILPGQEINNKKLYPVIAYYPNGKLKFSASSRTRSTSFVLQGSYITYFPNGKRKVVATVDNGFPIGDEISYYPNGNFYNQVKHEKNKTLLIECRDSTGVVLAQNGNGTWLDFQGNFNTKPANGPIKDGLRVGEWQILAGKALYDKGRLAKMLLDTMQLVDLNSKKRDAFALENTYLPTDGSPAYTGGSLKLQQFVYSNLIYPEQDKKDSIGGQVYIGFFVDKDGTTSNFNIITAPSVTLGKEALRIAKLLTQFEPGIKKGKPIKAPFVLPIYFSTDSLQKQIDTPPGTFFSDIDEQPSFPGGLAAFGSFLGKTIRYPVTERENHVMGKVFASFVVEKDGSLSGMHILATPSVGLAEEALRVLKLSPKWIPGSRQGKPVRVKYTLPISFTLG